MGDFELAREILEREVSYTEQLYGPDHPQLAHALKALAALMTSQANHREAERLYHRAQGILERSVGADNPDTAAVRAKVKKATDRHVVFPANSLQRDPKVGLEVLHWYPLPRDDGEAWYLIITFA